MQIFNLIEKLKDTGELDSLIRCGVIPLNVREYYDIHCRYQLMKKRQRKINRASEAFIKEQIGIELNIGRTKVYKAIAFMQQSAN